MSIHPNLIKTLPSEVVRNNLSAWTVILNDPGRTSEVKLADLEVAMWRSLLLHLMGVLNAEPGAAPHMNAGDQPN